MSYCLPYLFAQRVQGVQQGVLRGFTAFYEYKYDRGITGNSHLKMQ